MPVTQNKMRVSVDAPSRQTAHIILRKGVSVPAYVHPELTAQEAEALILELKDAVNKARTHNINISRRVWP